VLVVSHDRYFLDKVAERVVFIEVRRFIEYEGSFAEWWRDLGRPAASGEKAGKRAFGLEGRGRSVATAGRTADGGAAESRATESRALEDAINAMERQKEEYERKIAGAFDRREFKLAKELAAELERHNARLDGLWRRME